MNVTELSGFEIGGFIWTIIVVVQMMRLGDGCWRAKSMPSLGSLARAWLSVSYRFGPTLKGSPFSLESSTVGLSETKNGLLPESPPTLLAPPRNVAPP